VQQAAVSAGECFTITKQPTPLRVFCSAFGFQRNIRMIGTAEMPNFEVPETPVACPIFKAPDGYVEECKLRPLTDFAEEQRSQYIKSYLGESQAAGKDVETVFTELVSKSRAGLVAREVLRAYVSPGCDSKCIDAPEFRARMPIEVRAVIANHRHEIAAEDQRSLLVNRLRQSSDRSSQVAVKILESGAAPPLPTGRGDDDWNRYKAQLRAGPDANFTNYGDAELKQAITRIRKTDPTE